jgi:glycosyltransferase involved in cell wall biosynthesis
MDAEGTTARAALLRVFMTADTVGGVWRYALDLARELCQRGHRVTLAAMGPAPSRAQRADAKAIDGLTLRWRVCKLVWMDDPWSDLRGAANWLLRLAQRDHPNVIHANDFGHVALAWPAPVLCVAHSCVASWWRAVHGVAAPASWDRYRAHVRVALNTCDMLAAPSHAMAAALAREYGITRTVRVIANGAPGMHPARMRKRPLILAAGRLWDQAKNLAPLAAVAPELSWPTYFAGDNCAPDDTRTRFDGVHALGRLDPVAMQRWFERASIYALPARYEPFGLSILEAARAGCALVLGDIPSLREYWDGAARFVSPTDEEALRDALRAVIVDGHLRGQLASRGHLRARELTVARTADAYLNAYAEMAAAASSAPRMRSCA